MRAKVRRVWVLPAVGLIAAGVLAAVTVVVLTRSDGGDDPFHGYAVVEDLEQMEAFRALFQGADADARPTPPAYDDTETEVGWPLLRPSGTEFVLQSNVRWHVDLGWVRHRFFVGGPLAAGVWPPKQVYLVQQVGEPVSVWRAGDPGASAERIGDFATTLIDDGFTVRAWFKTGALAGDVPVIAIVDAPDRETLVRFIESLSFRNGAAD